MRSEQGGGFQSKSRMEGLVKPPEATVGAEWVLSTFSPLILTRCGP